MSAIYRARQFVRAASAWTRPQDAEQVRRYLSPAAADLFQGMPHYDRRHALDVLRTLQKRGYTNRDLLAAALLHDVGKTGHQAGRLRLWHRVGVVLMRAFWPGLLERLGQERPTGSGKSGRAWRQPFFVQLHHAALGAELALKAGCSPQTAELIRRHEDLAHAADNPLLAALQAADSVN